jgi:hypothetical protein
VIIWSARGQAQSQQASSGDSSEPANMHPALGAGSMPLPATSRVTGEQAAVGSWQLVSPEGGVTYMAALARSFAPFQPSGLLKPTAMGSDLSEPAVSCETANRHMSEDMSRPLSDKPDGTTSNAQVTNTCLPAGERPNKMPIFISGASDTRSFLAWLRASCPGGLTAQLKGEKMMVVSATADGFRAVVIALWSLNGREGVSFHTFTLPEDHCVRLLVKNLGRGMPESIVREELESLNIRVQESCSCDPASTTWTQPKTTLPPPTSLSQWREGLRCQKEIHSLNSADCECQWSCTWPQKAHCNASAASALDTRGVTADTRPSASCVVAPTSPVGALPRENSLSAVAAGETTL